MIDSIRELAAHQVRGLEQVDGEADRVADEHHRQVHAPRRCASQHAVFQQRHAEQHHAQALEQAMLDEERRFVVPALRCDHAECAEVALAHAAHRFLQLIARRLELLVGPRESFDRLALGLRQHFARAASVLRRRCGGADLAIAVPLSDGHGGLQDHDDRSCDDQLARRDVAEHEQQQADDAVVVQDVARPEQQIGVHQAENDQPHRAPEIQIRGQQPRVARGMTLQEQQCAGAEQQREHAAHRSFEEQRGDAPGRQVDARRRRPSWSGRRTRAAGRTR